MQYPLTQPGVDLSGGKFTDGNPALSIPASRDRAADMNLLYDELIAVVIAGGGTPAEGNSTQVRDAILALIKGGDYKDSVRVASTAAINLAAPGANIDGVAMVAGDRFLDKDNATLALRGIYIWNGAAVAATRATDADTGAELNGGAIIPVTEGTVNADSNWQITNDGVVTIGVTGLTFKQVGAVVDATETVKGIVEKATTAEARAFTADKYIDAQRLGEVAFGANQIWTDVTASRAASTNYTNSSGKPKLISINLSLTAGQSRSVTVDGLGVAGVSFAATNSLNITVLVPAGAVYSINGSFASWIELI